MHVWREPLMACALLAALARPREWVVSRAVSGNLRSMWGRYEIHPHAARGRLVLRYAGALEPDFALPPIVGTAALRGTLEDQFEAMVREIERRAGARPAADL